MYRTILSSVLMLCLSLALSSAQAGFIVAAADSDVENNTRFLSNVFSGQNVFARHGLNTQHSWATLDWAAPVQNVASSYTPREFVSAGDLQGIDWLISGSATDWSAAEFVLLNEFITLGGNLWVVGEYGPLYNEISRAGNAVLQAAGSGMRFDVSTFRVATAVPASGIADHPFTQGVTGWQRNPATQVFGGTPLITNIDGNVLLAVEDNGIAPPSNDPPNQSLPTPEVWLLLLSGLWLLRRHLPRPVAVPVRRRRRPRG